MKPSLRWASGATLVSGVLSILLGSCSVQNVGGVGGLDLPPSVHMERWESIGSGSCKGWLTNYGSYAARDVRVTFWYRTAAGDTSLTVMPTSTTIDPNQYVAVFAPPQITRGELRFPNLGTITWAGGSSFMPGDPPPQVHDLGFACLLDADTARVYARNEEGPAYHVVLSVETETGVTQIPLLQNPIGRLWSSGGNCPHGFASGCDGWGVFHVPVRDSAGVKLLPKFGSVRWENFAGVPDSTVPPYGWPYEFGQYGVTPCSP